MAGTPDFAGERPARSWRPLPLDEGCLRVPRDWSSGVDSGYLLRHGHQISRALYERIGFCESGIGAFTTSGTFVDEDGEERSWQHGPQVLLVQDLD